MYSDQFDIKPVANVVNLIAAN